MGARFLLHAFAWFSLLAVPVCGAASDQAFRFDIPQTDASEALMRLAQQASTPLLVPFDLVKVRQANSLHGEFTLREGLRRLLDGTGLIANIDGAGVIVVSNTTEPNEKLQSEANMGNLKKKTLLSSISAFILSAVGLGAHAQESQEFNEKMKSTILEEVVVSARRTEESLQRTPVSVAAVSGEQLQTLSVANLDTLDSFVPNFTSGTSPGYGWASLTIRGVGGGEGFITQDSSVGVYIDDIYYPRANGALLDLVDVERIEVLRGPQGTLFGRNTSGGAVRYISKKPKSEFGGEITGSIGNLKHRDFQAVANIPLDHELAARFTFASKNHGGFVTRLNDGVKTGDSNVVATRSQLRWQPTSRWDFNISVDTIQTHDNGPARDTPLINPTDLAPTALGNPGFTPSLVTPSRFTVVGGDPGRDEYESYGINATVQYDLSNNLSIKSLTGYRDSSQVSVLDWDQTEFDVYGVNNHFDFSNVSQELQLNGTVFDGRVKFVTGLYYLHEKAYQDGRRNDALNPRNSPEIRDVDTTSYAVFGQGTIKLTDNLGLTVGARWSKDKKDYFGVRGTASAGNSDDWTSFTPRLGFEFQVTDNLMAYVSAAKGFKAGGFNDTPRTGQLDNGIVPYNPENLWTYEGGIRSELADNRIRFNGTFFYTKYKDIQVPAAYFDPLLGTRLIVTQNAAAATVRGIEFDALALVTDALRFRLSGGWTDAGYDDVGGSSLKTDTPFQRTPKFSYTAGATYDHSLANNKGSLSFNIDYGWKDEQTSSNNTASSVVLPSYGLLNSRLSYAPATKNWSISVFGTNLLNKEYLVGAIDASTRSHFMGFAMYDLGRPREYGVELSARY